jgi:hypothetical protein
MSGTFDEAVEERLARTENPKLEPSGDAEHDKLTDQALGLDALHPLRDADKAEVNDEIAADEEHSD